MRCVLVNFAVTEFLAELLKEGRACIGLLRICLRAYTVHCDGEGMGARDCGSWVCWPTVREEGGNRKVEEERREEGGRREGGGRERREREMSTIFRIGFISSVKLPQKHPQRSTWRCVS